MADKKAGRKSPAKKRPSVEKTPERPADAEKHDELASAPAPKAGGRGAASKGQPLARSAAKARSDAAFLHRLHRHHDELRWLYMELYDNGDMFAELCDQMKVFYDARSESLKALDARREGHAWYRDRDLLGMQMYIDNFAGNIRGVEDRLDYLEQTGVNYLHLMPFLDTPADRSRSDGGYAVSDFRRVKPELGTMDDLARLAERCHEKNISLCMDFVMNHTSDEHEWARRARAGEGEYMSRYFFTGDQALIERYTRDVPQVFPTTAPGHFTYLPELYLANQGMDIIRIDAVPYIWKQLGTNCRNLPQVHTIVRMMRMIGEIVCPGIVLLGEVVMAPVEVVPYFGTVEKPECHMLYNVTTMATTWNSVACRDTRLLRRQLETVCDLPREYTFLNYLRCHDDIGWGLDYATLSDWGMEEVPHKHYLNAYFQGHTEGSVSRGELYNADPVTGDARFCATTASMCGIEAAGFAGDADAMDVAIRKDVMLHAYLLTQSGLPIVYSGDEVGQVNDYTYKDDPEKAEDSRYIHRGRFDWALVDRIEEPGSVQQRLYNALRALEEIRRDEAVFDADAEMSVVGYSDPSVLWIRRRAGEKTLHAVFNFSDEIRTLWMPERGEYADLVSGRRDEFETFELAAWDFRWWLR